MRKKLLLITNYALGFGLVVVAIGLALMIFLDVESVMGSGPVTLFYGAGLLVISGICRHWFALVIASSYVFIPILFTMLVLMFNWSPDDAEVPFSIMGGIYFFLLLVSSIIAIVYSPKAFGADQCQRCGYPLIGLTSRHCPECGSGFGVTTIHSA